MRSFTISLVPPDGRLPLRGDRPDPRRRTRTPDHPVTCSSSGQVSRPPRRSRRCVSGGTTGGSWCSAPRAIAPYDRPPLSKHLLDRPRPTWLADEIGADLLDPRGRGPPGHPGARALAVGGATARCSPTSGALSADALVVASGAHAVRPPGWEAALTLHTAADAERLRAALVPGARLVVIGAGWIGAEVAGVAAAAGVDVVVVEANGAPARRGARPDRRGADRPLVRRRGRPPADRRARGRGRHQRREPRGRQADRRRRRARGGRCAPDHRLAGRRAPPRAGRLAAGRRAPPGRRRAAAASGRWATSRCAAPRGTAGCPAGTGTARCGDRRRSSRTCWAPRPTPSPTWRPYVFSTQLGHELALFGAPHTDDEVVLRGDPAGGEGWARPVVPAGFRRASARSSRSTARATSAPPGRLFTAPGLPRLDRALAVDPGRPLREASLV